MSLIADLFSNVSQAPWLGRDLSGGVGTLLLGYVMPMIMRRSTQYRIPRSVRFNQADSARFSLTTGASPTNAKIWTASVWVKRSALGDKSSYYCILHAYNSDNGEQTDIRFDTSTGSGGTTDSLRVFSNVTSNTMDLRTTQLFRDPSAWIHVLVACDTTQATAANRVRVYINGSEVTAFSTATYPAQNASMYINAASRAHGIGARGSDGATPFDGYMAEFNFIDGQQLTPSSFGKTDAAIGQWVPKRYNGTFGTNGFYLDFSDNSNTTSSTLGKDRSGNNNDWTPNNLSVTAGVDNDSLVDTPTPYGADTGAGGEVRGNYPTFNAIIATVTGTYSNGNLDWVNGGGGTWRSATTSQAIPADKFYVEGTVKGGGSPNCFIGVLQDPVGGDCAMFVGNQSRGYGVQSSSTTWNAYNNGSSRAITGQTSAAAGDVQGLAIDASNSASVKVWIRKANGSWLEGDPATGTSPTFTFSKVGEIFFAFSGYEAADGWSLNCGQRPFANSAPSGFKALCTQNLPTPSIKRGDDAFVANLRTGTGAAFSVTGKRFQPDLVWTKGRSGATDHALYDSVRGVQKDIGSNLTTDETTEAQGVTAFNADGFSGGTLAKINTNAATYVDWMFRRGATYGIDIVTYTGNGSARTIAHSLGVVPKMIIIKARTTAGADQGWPVYHASNTAAPETDYLMLNTTAATADDTYWNDTAPTSSVFSLGTSAAVNANGDTYVAYVFAEVSGFSKMGSYTGNGSADGPFVWCGFRPRFVLIKQVDTTANWLLHDTARSTYNQAENLLYPNLNVAEETAANNRPVDILSNGFKCRNTDAAINASGGTYIFMAFAESPFKYSRAA